MIRRSLLSFGLFILINIWLLSGCTPPPGATVDGAGDWKMTGYCEIDEAGWEIDYDKSKERMEFMFWVSGGQCDYD